jgi:Na+-transporting NADH:ubiquinone oxidoreductase subunit NqrF
MTDMAKSHEPWTGVTGVIDKPMIERRLALHSPRYYVAGPPAMVIAMHAMLTKAGVGEDDICAEDFAGY